MSSTLLEVTRGAHEEVERLERLIVKDLQREPETNKERMHQNHRVRNMVDAIMSTTQKLVRQQQHPALLLCILSLSFVANGGIRVLNKQIESFDEQIEVYEDSDHSRKDEIAALGGQGVSGQNVFSAFYDRLKEIREYHRRHPIARVVDLEDPEELLKEEPRVEFSGEEAFGRYLDMHELYNEYVNSKFGQLIDYAAFLEEFPQTHNIPRTHKLTRQYKEYSRHLLEYLVSFFQRTQPLQDLDKIFSKVEAEFEEHWAGGMVQGWEDKGLGNGQPSTIQDFIDLDYYSSVDELVELGPEKLKQALAALGLKTGGTVQQRAERLFLTKVTPLEELDRKHFAKGSRPSARRTDDEILQLTASKEVALMEVKMKRLVEFLHETLEETKANVEKKQALTYEEMEAEREEEEIQAESESDEEDQQIYNPLKLPMGWDGKPIPYWLYKLHGLGQEFKCEICGNHSYWGRRAFERHFKEWRHQHGMRCLGIPNTKNFNEITSIKEAKFLWERIQERQGLNKWRPDLEEEYEDQEGNIYNKKTYTDLQRQGLI